MPPKAKGGARSRSNSAGSAKAKAEPKSKASARAKSSSSPTPAPKRDEEVEKTSGLLRECLAEKDIANVDGRVLDIAIGQARPLLERGLSQDLFSAAEARFKEYRAFEAELVKKKEELLTRKAEVVAQQDEENVTFSDACEERQRLKKRVEELFDAVGDSEIGKVRAWIRDCCVGGTDCFAPPPLPVDLQDHQLNTPLSEAACYGETEIVELLLENGAHPNSQNDQGRTPLWRAGYNGCEEVVELLLEKGADPRIENNNGEPAGKIGTDRTKALIAAWDTSQTATKQEALSDLQRLPKPWPLLLLDAVTAGDAAAAMRIVEAISSSTGGAGGPAALLRVVLDFETMTDALWLSCTKGHLELVRALADAGADVNSFNDTGLTCLMIACRKGHREIVQELLKRGAKTHLRSQQGRLATDYAREADGDTIHDLVVSHCRKTEDWSTLEEEARQSGGNKACSAEVLEGLGRNATASNAATAALRALPVEEIRDGSDRYKQLLEERALADVLGIG